ncbi:hypothetical protein VTJ49DRAFT_4718 [Mycothermus thermophilus]|uniref:Infection structure specific protein n=1 Tax=Humicola insolens TaxID=85995 RepID=A0ABR3V4P0_HUMIN
MRSAVVAIPVLATLMGVSNAAGALALTPLATYPPVRPAPKPYAHGGPGVNRPAFPAPTPQPGQKQDSALVLSQVPARPTATQISPEKCSEVASRITPQLTPNPTYPASLKAMADKIGGIERDTCGDLNLAARYKSVDAKELNKFTQARYQTFILPMWARVQELWAACGDEAARFPAVSTEPCYRWALELSKASNASFGVPGKGSNKVATDDKGQVGSDNKDNEQTAVEPESGAGAMSSTVAALVGTLALLGATVFV